MIARGVGGPFSGPQGPYLLVLILLVLGFLTGRLASPIQNAANDPTGFIGFLIAIVLGITVHEFMHAYVAHRLGDDTGRLMGRMSLNPMAHLDIFGSLLIVLIGFGYGKPVPVNESRLRGGRASWPFVAAAGPLTNFALAALCAIPIRFGGAELLGGAYLDVLLSIVYFNCLLGIFNLIPIPPLDGSKILYGLLPPSAAYGWRTYEQYGPLLLMLLFFFGGSIFFNIVIVPARAIASALLGQRI